MSWERKCDECTACCTVMGVEELKKVPMLTCEHVCASGCGIYADRPPTCKSFYCFWAGELSDVVVEHFVQIGRKPKPVMQVAERPDKLGVIFFLSESCADQDPNLKIQVVVGREVWPGAFNSPTAQAAIARIAAITIVLLLDKDENQTVRGPQWMLRKVKLKHTKVENPFG